MDRSVRQDTFGHGLWPWVLLAALILPYAACSRDVTYSRPDNYSHHDLFEPDNRRPDQVPQDEAAQPDGSADQATPDANTDPGDAPWPTDTIADDLSGSEIADEQPPDIRPPDGDALVEVTDVTPYEFVFDEFGAADEFMAPDDGSGSFDEFETGTDVRDTADEVAPGDEATPGDEVAPGDEVTPGDEVDSTDEVSEVDETHFPCDCWTEDEQSAPVDEIVFCDAMSDCGEVTPLCAAQAELPEAICCNDLPPVAGATCEVTAGDSNLLIRGKILTTENVLLGGEVLVAGNGIILCADCSCASWPQAAGATLISCPNGVVSPGLINAHDHLGYTYNPPGDWGTERYEHRHDWRKGRNGHTKITVPGSASGQEVAWGELRQVLAGTTTVAGSGGVAGLLRNIDHSFAMRHQVGPVEVDYQTFPLGDSDGTQLATGCNYPEIDPQTVLDADCYLAHVAEGINQFARNEFLCVSGQQAGGVDLTAPNSAFIHGVGLLSADGAELALNGTAIVWSPRSNVSLYGNTAPVTMYDAQGVLLALGSDWTASGSMNIVRELACAAHLNTVYYGGYFSDRQLWRMVTDQAAKALAVNEWLGSLKMGLKADIAIFSEHGAANPYATIITAAVRDTALVLRGGVPLYGDTALINAIAADPSGCDDMPGGVCNVAKKVCLGEMDTQFAALAQANADSYALYFCDVPANEPSCTPMRLGEYTGEVTTDDSDGDGILNDVDDCPTIFNPVRPLDNHAQADFDQDGLGDLCDPCPRSVNNEDCPVTNPDDEDGDGILDDVDNCVHVPNADQIDADSDGMGDVCDDCPDIANPGGTPCPVPIYDIKQGLIESGRNVLITGIVTAVASPRFFIQVPASEQDPALGATFSGIYVYVASANPDGFPIPNVGDEIAVSGQAALYYGQWQMSNLISVEILASAQPVPEPVVVATSDVGTGGPLASAYEGVLVRVEHGIVTDVQPPVGGGEAPPNNEYVLDAALRVNDLMYLTDPFPQTDCMYSITGLLRFANDNSKIEPRDSADVSWEGCPITISAFGPAMVSIDESDEWSETTPSLMVTLSQPAPAGGITILFASERPLDLEVPPSISIPEGEQEAVVMVHGIHGGSVPVVVTAALGLVQRTAQVLVIAPDQEPVPAVIELPDEPLFSGSTVNVIVYLDIPARPGDVQVDLAYSDSAIIEGPAFVTIPAGMLSAGFEIDALSEGTAVLTASTAAGFIQAEVRIQTPTPMGLVLSEVFYDPGGTDDGLEWVELYNGSALPIDLSGYSLGAGGLHYNETKSALSGTILPGQCIVVGGPTSAAGNFEPQYALLINFNPDLQNSGSLADGVGLFAVPASALTAATIPIDSVIYGTTNSSNLMDPSGQPGAVNVGDAASNQSIERTYNGWQIQGTPNPNHCNAALP